MKPLAFTFSFFPSRIFITVPLSPSRAAFWSFDTLGCGAGSLLYKQQIADQMQVGRIEYDAVGEDVGVEGKEGDQVMEPAEEVDGTAAHMESAAGRKASRSELCEAPTTPVHGQRPPRAFITHASSPVTPQLHNDDEHGHDDCHSQLRARSHELQGDRLRRCAMGKSRYIM
mmetsp:Transcript_30969/g.53238  ORF Transcript_30969/g.53238 Transcript_30969/m.53238 type:complete len:171 (+) Transcript_30969:1459-1971(+)